MASIYKRNNVWYSNLWIGGKRVRRALHTDRRAAEERLAGLIQEQKATKYGAAPNILPWPNFRDKYLEYSKGNKAQETHNRDRFAILAFEKFFTPKKLSDITPEELEKWKGARKQAGLGVATINRDLRAIKTMMHKAEAWGYVQPQSWRTVKKFKETRGRLLFYTVKEFKHLRSLCNGKWKTIVLLGARAGLRRSEIYWLSWEDLDFYKKRIHICAKGGWNPKDFEQRWVPMSRDLYKYLKNLQREGRWVLGDDRPDLKVITAYMRKLSRKAGLKGNIHTLRHTFASHLAMGGAKIAAISKILGHSNIQTTMIYAHLSDESIDSTIDHLPDA